MQGNLPLSVELGDRWVTHGNLGATFIPGAEGPDGSRYGVFFYLSFEHPLFGRKAS